MATNDGEAVCTCGLYVAARPSRKRVQPRNRMRDNRTSESVRARPVTGAPTARIHVHDGEKMPKTLIVAGAGFTGSGAIVDSMRQCRSVTPILKNGAESKLFWARHGIGVVHSALRDKGISAPQISALTAELLGWGDDERHRNKNRSLLASHGFPYIRAVLELARSMENVARRSDMGELYCAVNEFYERLRLLVGGESQTLLVNNDPPAFEVSLAELIRMVPQGRAIFVVRDPRDAFVDYMQKSGQNETLSVDDRYDKWVKRYRKAIRNNCLDNNPKVDIVKFEEFVLSDTVRRRLSQVCEVEYEEMVGEFFKPQESKNNIGIYKNFDHKSIINKLETEFPEYVFQ